MFLEKIQSPGLAHPSYGLGDGDTFDVNDLHLEVLETPGHTDESISVVIRVRQFRDTAVGVFTGDELFVGDQVLLYPAHSVGSVCGDGMAPRGFSTLGFERLNNPALNMESWEAFIEAKVAEDHEQPPFFRKMEQDRRPDHDA